MRIGISSSGDWSDTMAWLKRAGRKVPTATLNKIGSQGDKALAGRTPRRTGITAAGWGHEVIPTSSGADLYWYNDAYPNLTVNVASLLNYGHGTGTGGYVAPLNFIKPALDSILASAGDQIAKEMIE